MQLQSDRYNPSRDTHVYIFSNTKMRQLARALILVVVFLLLSAPLIICNALGSMAARIMVVNLSLAVFLTALSKVTTVRPLELFVAGAT